MMGIGFAELSVILVIIMIIFGAGKLPQIGSAFGQSIRNFKSSMREAEEMDAQEKVEEAAQPTAESSGETQVASLPASGGETVAASQPAPQPAAAPAPQQAPAPTAKAPAPAQAQASPNPKAKKSGKGKEEKSFEEELIDQAIKEIKDKRIGTIRTPHDGLVQQGDVFTKSVDRTPWHMKGRDRGVNRDVF